MPLSLALLLGPARAAAPRRSAGRGFAVPAVLAALALAGLVASAVGSGSILVARMSRDVTYTDGSRMVVKQALMQLVVDSSDGDGDGFPEPPAMDTSGSAKPAGGGNVPATSAAPKSDAWGSPLGYCAWDNGATNTSAGRIDGDNPAHQGSVALAVVSAGPGKTFDTSCTQARAGSPQGDDIVMLYTTAQVLQGVGGTVFWGDPVSDYGTLAALPASALQSGEQRIQKDTGQVWRWDGAAWKSVNGISYVDSTGRVGVGAGVTQGQSLFATLTADRGSAGEALRLGAGSNDQGISFGGKSSITTSGNAVDMVLQAYTQTNQLVLKSSGYVGVGTAKPSGLLHVVDASDDTTVARFSRVGSNAFLVSDHTLQINPQGSFAVNSAGSATVKASSQLALLAGADIMFQRANDNAEFLRIKTDTGHVGIGTSAPQNKLHIATSADGQGLTLDAGGEIIGSLMRSTVGTTVGLALEGANGRQISINGGASSHVLLANGGGNVGIGTNAPAYRLDVAGDINASGHLMASGNLLATGSVYAANVRQYALERTLPTSVGDTVDIGSFAIANSGHALDVAVTVSDTGYSASKRYLLPVQACGGCTTAAWAKALPLSSTGAYGGNDSDLEVMQDNTTQRFWLRLRRTAGTTAAKAAVTIHDRGAAADAFTAGSTVTAAPAAATGFWGGTAITQVGGLVGIGTAAPTSALTLVQNSAGTHALRLDLTNTNSTADVYGQYTTHVFDPAAAPAAARTEMGSLSSVETSSALSNGFVSLYGAAGRARLTGAATANFLVGTYSSAQNRGTGLAPSVFGAFSLAASYSTGGITNAYGSAAQVTNSGTGTLANTHALLAYNPSNTGGGSITNNYGVYVQNQTAGVNDYGLYIEGADTTALHVAAGKSYFGGLVGISTTSPTQALHVAGNARLTGALYDSTNSPGTSGQVLTSTVTGTAWQNMATAIGNAGGYVQGGNSFGALATLGTNDAFALALRTGGAERLRIDASGNVGIGTSSPTVRLDVTADTGAAPSLQLWNTNTADGRATMLFRNDRSTTQSYEFGLNPGGGSNKSFSLRNLTAGTYPWTVLANGNMGVGTSAPLSRLTVASSSGTGMQSTNGGVADLHVGTQLATAGTSGEAVRLALQPYGHTGGPWNFVARDVTSSAYLDLRYSTVGTLLTLRAGVLPNAVGIASQSPDSTLEVGGTIGQLIGTERVYKGVAAYSNSTASVTGTMKITLPKLWSNTMMQVKVSGYDHSSAGAWELLLGGYNYSGTSSWVNLSAAQTGRAPFTGIRLASDGSNNVILLGTTGTVWHYPKLMVSAFVPGHANTSGWSTGWSIAPITDESAIVASTSLSPDIYTDATGKVGIGTTSPAYKLDVAGQAMATGFLVPGGAGTANWQVTRGGTGSNNLYVQDTQATPNYFMTFDQTGDMGYGSRSVVMRQTAVALGNAYLATTSGSVGIGTASPAYKLTVQNATTAGTTATALSALNPLAYFDNGSAANGAIVIKSHNVGAGNVHGALRFATSPDSVNYSWSGIAGLSTTANAAADALAFYTSPTNTTGAASVERMRIDMSGNVGIGTTTPGALLDVAGTIKHGDVLYHTNSFWNKLAWAQFTTPNNAGDSVFIGAGGTTVVGAGEAATTLMGGLPNNGTENLYLAADAEVRIVTGLNAGYATRVEAMTLTAAGNVGIGTTAPTARLDVSGGNLNLDNTSFASATGVVTKGGVVFLHNFNYGNNGTVMTTGQNTFLGLNAGNLTMGATATQTYHGTANTGIGQNALLALSTGYYNTGLGVNAMRSMATGYYNTAVGVNALYSNVSGGYNTALGESAGYNGSVALQTVANSTFIGRGATSTVDGVVNSMALGYGAQVTKSNQVVIGNGSIVETLLSGSVGIGTTSPAFPLDVVGSIKTRRTTTDQTGITLSTVAASEPKIEFNASDNSARFRLHMRDVNLSTERLSFYAGPLGSAASTEAMVLGGNGNLGLGTTAPAKRLEVAGVGGTANVRLGSLSGSGLSTALVSADGLVVADANGDLTKRSVSAVLAGSDTGVGQLAYNGDFELGSDGWTGMITPTIVTGGYAGTNAAQYTGPANLLSSTYIPVDPTRDVFQLEGWVKKTVAGTTPGLFYFGYVAYDGNKAVISSVGHCNTHCYFAASAYPLAADGAWHKFSATTTGEGSAYPTFPVGTRYVRILALVNYAASADAVTLVDHISLRRANHGALFVGNNFSTTNGVDQFQTTALYTTAASHFIITPPSGGNVGIGTASPAKTLDVVGTASISGNLTLQGQSTIWNNGSAMDIQAGSGATAGMRVGTSAATPMVLYTNGLERARLDAAGNLGIGTATPAAKLQVSSSAYMLHLGEGGTGAGIDFRNRLAALPTTGTMATVGWMESTSGFTAGTLLLGSRPTVGGVILSADGTANVYLSPSGLLAVGHTAPTSRLHVVGSTPNDQIVLAQNTNAAGLGGFVAKDDTGNRFLTAGINNSASALSVGYGVAGEALLRSSTNALGLVLSADSTTGYVRALTNGAERLRVTAAGNLLIGTTTDNAVDKLQVAGTISTYGLAVPNQGKVVPLSVRGTGLNNSAASHVIVGNTVVASSTARGLTLVVLNKADHSVASSAAYDTYSSAAQSDSLAVALNAITNAQIGVLMSFDAWEANVSANLKAAALSRGLTRLVGQAGTGARAPYASVFDGATAAAVGTGRAQECLLSSNASAPYCDLRGWLANGAFGMGGGTLPNALAVPDGSSTAVFVATTGFVGIGTTAPDARLVVAGDVLVPNGNTYRARLADGTSKALLGLNGSNVTQLHGGGGGTAFMNGANVELARLSNAGYLGIGTSAPTAPLHVVGTATSAVDVAGHTRLTTLSQGATSTERFYPNVVSSAQNTTVNGAWVVHTPIPRGSNRMFKLRVHGYWYGATSQRLVDFTVVGYPYANNNGNVDGAPGAVIARDIIDQGTDGLNKYIGVDAAGNVAVALGDAGSSIYYGRLSVDAWITQGTSEFPTGWSIDQNTTAGFGWGDLNGPLKPSANAALSGTANYLPKFLTASTLGNSSIFDNGNVGIGTATPLHKLHVAGNAHVTGAFNDSSNSPGTSGQLLTSSVTGTAWRSAATALATTAHLQGGNSFGALATLGTNDAFDLALRTSGVEQVRITAAGSMGIGTSTPGYKLEVAGAVGATAFTNTSDLRFKRNLMPITGAMSFLKRLRGVTYQWRTEEFPQRGFDARPQIGFIAQEVEQVLPELVSTDGQGFKSVAYMGVIPLVVEAVKELQAQMGPLLPLAAVATKLGLESDGKAVAVRADLKVDGALLVAGDLSAQVLRAKKVVADEVRAGRLVTGDAQIRVDGGTMVELLELPVGSAYSVVLTGADGSYAHATVFNTGGVVQIGAKQVHGLELVAQGNRLRVVNTTAATKVLAASWIRVG